jgi:predicted ArsR family transcriptional regulator
MQLTRQQIVDYLQSNRTATPIELSRALQVTAANIRHHLKQLKQNGLVEVVGTRPVRGRGRPMKLYSLTENALRNNLDGLASALLNTLPNDTDRQGGKLAEVAANLLGDYQTTASMHARLNQAVERLNELEYQSTWEASPNGPRIILRNCPYALILDEHPELCQIDAALISQLLGQPVEQTAKLERTPDGTPHCAFVLARPGQAD